ncbi:MAG: hypothetical protein ACO1N9_03670 [Flavobacterium sp.]
MFKFIVALLFSVSLFAQNGAFIKQSKYGTLYKYPANPAAGYSFEYLLYMPVKAVKDRPMHLLVETNNTGVLNDTIAVHEKAAINQASESGVGNYVAEKLGLPFLVPVFPRPAKNPLLYTHALDRDTFLEKGTLERLDLQLIAMMNDAKQQLVKLGYRVNEKIFFTGFSASGTFANRFSLLHPEMVQAIAAGGINAIVILPKDKLNGKKLEYPLGTCGLKTLTGRKVNIQEYTEVPKMLYMGENDDNDAAAFDDAYSASEREIIYSLMGKDLGKRWQFMRKVYEDNGIAGEFITYPGIGHGTDLKINNALAEFFRKHSE